MSNLNPSKIARTARELSNLYGDSLPETLDELPEQSLLLKDAAHDLFREHAPEAILEHENSRAITEAILMDVMVREFSFSSDEKTLVGENTNWYEVVFAFISACKWVELGLKQAPPRV